MSTWEVTSMSTKGQVVIPRSVRADLGLKPGSKLVVLSDGQNVLLKPVTAPKLTVFNQLIAQSRAYARRARLRKSDVQTAIQKVRHADRG